MHRRSVTQGNQLATTRHRVRRDRVDTQVRGWTGIVADIVEPRVWRTTIQRLACRRQQRGSDGQALVEFAIVGGLLFFLIFSVINAGFYLYGANAMQYAADIGVATIAAEGNYDNPLAPAPNSADSVALSRMDAAGLNHTPLITVSEVDIYKETTSGGVFSDAATCGGGASLCVNRYTADGTLIGTEMWDSAIRNVGPAPDFAKLVITFRYTLLLGATTFNSTTVNLFRLEPQT